MIRWVIEGNEQDLARLMELIGEPDETEAETDKVTALKVAQQKGVEKA